MARIRLLLIVCVIIWGWTFVATKICLAYLNPYELIGLRFLIGLPLLFAVIRFRNIPLQFTSRDIASLSCGSLIIATHFIIQAIALNYTSATNTGWIIAVTPLALAILSFAILRERIGKEEIVGICVASLGILLLVSGGDFSHLAWLSSIGDWLILLSAHTWALYTIVSRNISRTRNPLSVTLIMFLPLTIGCCIYSMSTSPFDKFLSLPFEPLIALIFLGILGTLTQWIWQEGIAKIGAARAGIYLYLEPLATTILAVPLLKEPITIATVLGGFSVLGGVWWAQRRNNQKH